MVLALLATGCRDHYASPRTGDDMAQIAADEAVMIESIDGVMSARAFRTDTTLLPPGRHSIRVRRRIEVPIDTRGALAAPFGYSMRVATDAHGSAAYVSDSSCTVAFEAHPAGRYRARIVGADAQAWVGSVEGPDVDVRCTGRDGVLDELIGSTRYLCCAMSFDDGVATDANYRYVGGAQLAPGTPVVVTAAGLNNVSFRAASDGGTYRVYLEHGLARTDAVEFFGNVLREDDPSREIASLDPAIRGAVADGRLVAGMTREQAILARGYPPLHRTPDRSAREWLYYDAPGEGVYVTFADGVIKSIRTAPAP